MVDKVALRLKGVKDHYLTMNVSKLLTIFLNLKCIEAAMNLYIPQEEALSILGKYNIDIVYIYPYISKFRRPNFET